MTTSDVEVWSTDGAVRTASVRAPAKLNLGLRIVGRRPDGYHLLESIFVPLDLADELTLRVEPARRTRVLLTVEGGPPELETDDRNLAVRAATAFFDSAGQPAEVQVTLTKKIPVGAGMGGGSSDAGSVLRALASGHPQAVSAPRLAALAASLGADIPYFLDPRPALVRGIGEQIEPIAGFPALPVVVATPQPPLRTADVFRAWDGPPSGGSVRAGLALTPAEPGRRMPSLSALWNGGGGDRAEEPDPRVSLEASPSDWRELLVNDLEDTAADLQPGVARLRIEIERSGARAVGMSGSGPTIFGLFGSAEEARAAALRISWDPTDHVHVGNTTSSP